MMAYDRIRSLNGVELAEYLLNNAGQIAMALEAKSRYERALTDIAYLAEMNPNNSKECGDRARTALTNQIPHRQPLDVSNTEFARTARNAKSIIAGIKSKSGKIK